MISSIRDFISKKRKQRELGRKGLVNSRKRLKSGETLSYHADQSKILSLAILFILWCVCVSILVLPNPKTSGIFLVATQKAPQSIFTDFDFQFENTDATKEMKEAAKASVPVFYRVNPESLINISNEAKVIFEEIQKRIATEKVAQPYSIKPDNKASKFTGSLDKKVLTDIQQFIQSPELQKNYINQLTSVLERGIISQKEKDNHAYGQKVRIIDVKNRIKQPSLVANILTPSEASERIADETMKYLSAGSKSSIKKSIIEITSFLMDDAGNLSYDEDTTSVAKKEAEAQIKPVMVEIKKSQPIITKDQIIDNEDIRRVKLYDEQFKERVSSINFWQQFQRSAIICFFMMIITGLYIYHIHPEMVRSNQKIWLATTTVIVAIVINYLIIKGFNTFSSEFNIQPIMLLKIIPIGFTSILISVLIGLRVALYAGLFVSIITALMLDSSFKVLMEGLAVSCIAGFLVRNSTNYRSFFLRALFAVPVSMILLDISLLWEIHTSPMEIMLIAFGSSIANGLITAVLALLFLFFFESIFQVSTNMALISLCDYNHPLLKRLQFEAPGTYHHSIMVSTLAEQAAQEIKANPIKARVCSLFHDIGKLAQPEYFTENNMTGESKHKELHPRMSSLIILNHVKEGIDMAFKYKLRKIVRDAIEQHHGTDLVYFFYKRAIMENPDKTTPIEEQEYRYPGPLPREKEVVIVSLADACEAASRSIQKPTPAKIDTMVWELFRKRIRDGQLDEAELTFGELAKIRESFVMTLSTMLHGRIAYPKDEEFEDEDDLFVAAKKVSNAEPNPSETVDE